ncbi:MAG: diguanylate cyclase domain-containing protein [Solirubrobacteraceae bacterium]
MSQGQNFSCSMSAVLLAEIRDFGGQDAVTELLRLAESRRSAADLTDLTNWISYDEAVALWRAGALLTHNPRFPELVGRRAAQRLSSSSVATLLRSLGSPGKLYEQITLSASKFSTVVRMEALDVGPRHAEISAAPVAGYPRSAEHCAWTLGLLSAGPNLFGMPSASVSHERCAAFGAPACVYEIRWGEGPGESEETSQLAAEVESLRNQVAGMQERLHSMFAAASDLIAADDIADVLARITDRAALQVRAPRYLLAVRMQPEGEVHCHHRGFEPAEVPDTVERILSEEESQHPRSWLVVRVRSDRREYGSLMAAFDSEVGFFPQERELFEVYARYAASALDGAAALFEAKRRYDQSSALLKLAQALSTARTSDEVAQRLAAAVPLVVDCDRVGVYLWDPGRGQLVRRALTSRNPDDPLREETWTRAPTPGGPLDRLLKEPHTDPLFVDGQSGDHLLRDELERVGETAAILAPICTQDTFLGLLKVSVRTGPHRLRPNPDLLNRLAGASAQATTALQNGLLVDQITHQAEHDQLTGLPNRARFDGALRSAVDVARHRGELVAVLYVDLNAFKPVNDEFGHDVGDQVLARVAARLGGCTRAGDTVARLGGDEFAVVAHPLASVAEADALADRLMSAFRDPFMVGPHELRVSASLGRAIFPIDGDDAEAVVRRADASMFENKRSAFSTR